MRRLGPFSTILFMLSVAAAAPALAQTKPESAPDGPAQASGAPGANVSAVGRKMPPASGRPPAGAAAEAEKSGAKASGAKASRAKTAAADAKTANETEMLKAQKAAEERNKAWDSKMRKTMGSICSGC